MLPADRMYVTDVRQTDVRQHHRLMPPKRGHNKLTCKSTKSIWNKKSGRTVGIVDRKHQHGYSENRK